jgi:hypothetical protein
MQQAFAEAGIPALPEHAYEQFEAYLDLLLRPGTGANHSPPFR